MLAVILLSRGQHTCCFPAHAQSSTKATWWVLSVEAKLAARDESEDRREATVLRNQMSVTGSGAKRMPVTLAVDGRITCIYSSAHRRSCGQPRQTSLGMRCYFVHCCLRGTHTLIIIPN